MTQAAPAGPRLSWGVTYVHDLVERRVWADAELRAGDIVVDRSWDHDDRNTELLVLVARLSQHQGTVVGLQTAA